MATFYLLNPSRTIWSV